MNRFDVGILAAGRLHDDATNNGELKASIPLADTTLLGVAVKAFRSIPAVDRIIVVAPRELFASPLPVDAWIEERPTGEENIMAILAVARTERMIVSASDLPFIEAAHIEQFLSLVSEDVDVAYPVFTREEFLAAFPGGRTAFAPLRGHEWTGGSLALMNVKLACENGVLIRRGFAARKSQLAMAGLLGPHILLRLVTRTLQLQHIERRIAHLTGGKIAAVTGAHPALAMDCDSSADVAYVRARQ